MDNKTKQNAKTGASPGHLLPKGIRGIHQRYGLWICKFCRGWQAAPRRPKELEFRPFAYYDLSHMYDGNGWYCAASDGVVRPVEKGDAILVSPGALHKYSGDGAPYVEDAISFHGPVADLLFESGILKDGILRIGPARRLLPVIELAGDTSDDGQIKANLALQNLLVELYFENKATEASPLSEAFDSLLVEIRKEPVRWWDIDSMAEYCNTSPTQFKRRFKQMTGVTAKNYIDQFKTQLAVEMLSDPARTINDIAVAVGYPDPYHFSRRFKQLTGHAPTDYRRLFCR